jgi:hypothetical protein
MTHDEQVTVNAIWRFLDENERRRAERQARDEEWRSEVKADIKELKASLTNVPCIMDDKISACRDSRVDVTEDAVKTVTQLKDFVVVTLKLAAAAGVITGAVLGVGRLFGWI